MFYNSNKMVRCKILSLLDFLVMVVLLTNYCINSASVDVVDEDEVKLELNKEKREIAEGPEFEDLPPIMRKYSIPSQALESASEQEPTSAMDKIFEANRHLIEEHVPGLFEGDMYYGPQIARAAVDRDDRRWPNGIVPYEIDPIYDKESVRRIKNAMEDYHRYTCIRFVQRTSQRNYVFITPLDGCWSGVGFGDLGRHKVSLGDGCVWHSTILHELMHLLGFIHEQGRTDRDNYVRLIKENMIAAYEGQFGKVLDPLTTQGTPYDYDSLMHYSRTAFTKNGGPTIVSINDFNRELGGARTFSYWDFVELNGRYNCGYDDEIWYNNKKECILNPNTERRGANINDGNLNKMYTIESCCESCQNTPNCKSFTVDKRPGSTFGNCYLKYDWGEAWSDDCCDSGIIWPWPDDEEDEDNGGGGGGGDEDCVDKNESCEAWAAIGECEKNAAYMLPNCAKSCRPECSKDSNCVDDNGQCAPWANQGECDKNPGYMKVNCKKSCGVCASENCLDKDDSCPQWAENGECTKNPGWMLPNCKKSCQQCGST
ncbi:zinc metalloproteinase nas-13-like [Ptychodera flava]|uniref:zinc metalloproteinase nas-13-like n=1 Tax=Ptychodera flava TaxID=63121 RepID=UPI00396A938C